MKNSLRNLQKKDISVKINELASISKQERFSVLFEYVTTCIKNKESLLLIINALRGHVEDSIIPQATVIGELSAKGFIPKIYAELLINLAIINDKAT